MQATNFMRELARPGEYPPMSPEASSDEAAHQNALSPGCDFEGQEHGDNPFHVLLLDFVHSEYPMSVAMGRPATEHAPTTGSDMRRWASAGLMLAGGAATLIGIGLPWGHAGAT